MVTDITLVMALCAGVLIGRNTVNEESEAVPSVSLKNMDVQIQIPDLRKQRTVTGSVSMIMPTPLSI